MQLASASPTNLCAIQNVPSAPTTKVSNNLAVTTDLKISISWTVLPTVVSWGGIDIKQYEVWWMQDVDFEYELFYSDSVPF